MRELELICGDPKNGARSYSRFVIPFAYRLKARGGEKPKETYSYKNLYKNANTKELHGLEWRKKYFTCETEKVLFESAHWFELEKDSSKDRSPVRIDFQLDGKIGKISAFLNAPQLVLFEFSEDVPNRASDEKGWDILQVGFLILEVYFDENNGDKPTLDDLIKINEIFRYIDEPFEGHYKGERRKNLLDDNSLKKLRFGNEGNKRKEEDDFYKRWWSLLDKRLVDGKWTIEYARATTSGDEENSKNTYPDNRAFVWTCAILPEGAKHLWRAFPFTDWKARNYGHWIKLLNVDFPGTTPEETHGSREFERKWAEEHTYHRWEEERTYYGFTSHSGAVIAPPYNDPPIWQHFGQMYFDQVLLLLYLRSVLFRFSAKLSQISREARDNRNGAKDRWAEEFQKLRWEFALFTNLYQFPLLSNQQQGIELYTLARKCMEVDELFKEVQEEIHSSHDYLSQQQNQVQTNITTILTKLAAIVSVIGLTIALFSMSVFVESPGVQWCTTTIGKFTTFLLFLATFLLLLVIMWLILRKKKSNI